MRLKITASFAHYAHKHTDSHTIRVVIYLSARQFVRQSFFNKQQYLITSPIGIPERLRDLPYDLSWPEVERGAFPTVYIRDRRRTHISFYIKLSSGQLVAVHSRQSLIVFTLLLSTHD